MKKWLNIQPKVYEFSEDEIDTETDSEDDGMVLEFNNLHKNAFSLCFQRLIYVFFFLSQFARLKMREQICMKIIPIRSNGTNMYQVISQARIDFPINNFLN